MKKMLVLFVSLIALQACKTGGDGGGSDSNSSGSNSGKNSNSPTVFSEINSHTLYPAVGTSGNNDFYYFLDTTTNSYTIRRLGDDANPHPKVYDKIPASATGLDFGTVGSRFFATYTDQGTTKFLEYKGDNNWVVPMFDKPPPVVPATPDFTLVPWDDKFFTVDKYYTSFSPLSFTAEQPRIGYGLTMPYSQGLFPGGVTGNGPQNKNPGVANGALYMYGAVKNVPETFYRPIISQAAAPGFEINKMDRTDLDADAPSLIDYHTQALTYGIVDGTGVYLVGLQNRDKKSVNLLRASGVKQRWSPVKEFVAVPNQTQVIKTLDFKEGKFVLMVEKNLGGKLSCVLNISGDLKTFVENTKQNSSCLLLTNYGGVFRLYTSTNQDPNNPDPSKTVAKNYLAVTLYDSASGKPVP